MVDTGMIIVTTGTAASAGGGSLAIDMLSPTASAGPLSLSSTSGSSSCCSGQMATISLPASSSASLGAQYLRKRPSPFAAPDPSDNGDGLKREDLVPLPVVSPMANKIINKRSKQGCFRVNGRKNEDRLIQGVCVYEKNGGQVDLNVVIDGHGGAGTAEYLERQLPSMIRLLCAQRSTVLDTDFVEAGAWTGLLKEAFERCSNEWDALATTFEQKKAGAVVTMILVSGAKCFIAHVGDGKVLASCGSDGNFEELTSDHRADNPSERERIESVGGSVVNGRVRGVLAPSRAFGDLLIRTDVTGEVNNMIIRPEPEIVRFEMDRPGFVVIATDGLFDVFSNRAITVALSMFLKKSASSMLPTTTTMTAPLDNNNNDHATKAARYLAEQAALQTDDDVSVIVLMWD